MLVALSTKKGGGEKREVKKERQKRDEGGKWREEGRKEGEGEERIRRKRHGRGRKKKRKREHREK